jgi:hypothetical protein
MKKTVLLTTVLFLVASSFQILQALDFQRIFPEITGEVKEIKCGAVDYLGEYGYFFVLPDSGLAYYNYSSILGYHNSPLLPVVSSECIGNNNVTDKIYCALGAGSYSDGIYEYNTETEEFSLKTWLFSPKFVKYLNSGFYAGALEGLLYSPDGDAWSDIDYFTDYDVKGIVEISDRRQFVSAKKLGEETSVIVMKNGTDYSEFDTGFPDINCIYYRKSGDYSEVLVTLGSGTYSDGLYRVLYNDSTITGFELIEFVFEPNLVLYYLNHYIVTSKKSADITAIPSSVVNGDSFIIEHGLDISRINCFQPQYPIYTPNFMIGTDNGIYLVTGTVGIEDISIPGTTELYQNYPNPFNPATAIRYSLAADADVKLAVFDIAGREVTELVSGRQERGNHSVNFNADGLTSGIYLYRLSVDGKAVQSKKMMMLK